LKKNIDKANQQGDNSGDGVERGLVFNHMDNEKAACKSAKDFHYGVGPRFRCPEGQGRKNKQKKEKAFRKS
jgi:hypothetical protein